MAVVFLAVAVASPGFGRYAAIEDTLKAADAVAFCSVVSIAEDLKDGMVTRRATLNVIGKSHGLNGSALFEVPFGQPSKLGTHRFASGSALFLLGRRCIVVLKREEGRLHVLRQIHVSDDGKIEEPGVFRTLGFDRGAEAEFAVDCLVTGMKKMSR